MKKKSGKKKRVTRRQKTQKFDIRKTWQFRLLVVLIILLVILIGVYLFVYEPVVEDKGLDGELPTLGFGVGSTDVYLEVIDYLISFCLTSKFFSKISKFTS